MNNSVEQILRESREKRRKTLEIRRVNHSDDVEMKNYATSSRKTKYFNRNRKMNKRFDQKNRNKPDDFKMRKAFRKDRKGKNFKRRFNNSRLYISNLNLDTTNYDLKTLFESIGPLRRCGIHWNELGQSKGTAEVEFFDRQHASDAKNKFNCKKYFEHLLLAGTLKGVPIKINWARNRIINGGMNGNVRDKNFNGDPRLRKRLGRRRVR